MRYYIDPLNMSKEEFLESRGTEISAASALAHNFNMESLPVCLVDNGFFTAAGIGYCPEEVEAFARPDGRTKTWYLVFKDDLEPYYKGD